MTVAGERLNRLGQTPWQTVGPFFHYALPWAGGADLVSNTDIGARVDLLASGHAMPPGPPRRGAVDGRRIEIEGCVYDAEGEPAADALLEIWQANAAGRYASLSDPREGLPLDPDFTGFGRAATGADGRYLFRTIEPGRVPGPGGSLQAPHIAVGVLGRGLMRRLITRIYLEDGEGLRDDPILALAPEARRDTLIARRSAAGDGRYSFDIHLGGEHETVFFDL